MTKAISSRNSFQTQARGTFVRLEHGTRIQVSLGLSPIVLGFSVLWFLVVELALVVGGLAGGFAVEPSARFPLELIPLAMLVGGAGLFGIGRLTARGEGAFLLRFLQDELEAQDGQPERGLAQALAVTSQVGKWRAFDALVGAGGGC